MGDYYYYFFFRTSQPVDFSFINCFNTFKFQEIVNLIRILLVIIKRDIKEMGLGMVSHIQ